MKKKIMVAGFAVAMAAVGALNINKVSNVNSEMDLVSLIAVNTAQAEGDINWFCWKDGYPCQAIIRPGQEQWDGGW